MGSRGGRVQDREPRFGDAAGDERVEHGPRALSSEGRRRVLVGAGMADDRDRRDVGVGVEGGGNVVEDGLARGRDLGGLRPEVDPLDDGRLASNLNRGVVRAAVVVVGPVVGLRVVRTHVLGVHDAVPVVVEIGAAVRIFEAVPVLRMVRAEVVGARNGIGIGIGSGGRGLRLATGRRGGGRTRGQRENAEEPQRRRHPTSLRREPRDVTEGLAGHHAGARGLTSMLDAHASPYRSRRPTRATKVLASAVMSASLVSSHSAH